MRWLGLLWLAACGTNQLVCTAATDCIDSMGNFGRCVASYCAYHDPNCGSQFRWDDTAGPYAKMCVPPAALIPDAGAGADAHP
jgi:hypothetical protein